MGILDRILRRKKEEPLPVEPEIPKSELTAEAVTIDNVKAKMDSILIQLDTLNTRIEQMERMVREIYVIAKKSA